MNDDAILLRRYSEEGSEEAFTALVQKYVDLVYSAALRRTGGDAHRAADVAQEVFTALARQARALTGHPVLGAWLHATTRNIAVNRMRSDQRREQRQQVALELAATHVATPAAEWEQMRPVLDAAIDELPERDRRPVVMRFLERRPFKEIGAALTISEDAARVRTDRALEKLRAALARRGITSTAAAMSAVISTHATIGAPAGMAASMATKSLAGASATGSGATVFSMGVVGPVLASAVLAFAAGAYFGPRQAVAPAGAGDGALPASPASAVGGDAVSAENRRLAAEVQRLNGEVTALRSGQARLASEIAQHAAGNRGRIIGAPLPRHQIQESVIHNLRQLAAAQDQYHLETGRWPASIQDIVGATAYVRRVVPVDGEDYTTLAFNGSDFVLTTAGGVTVGYANDGKKYDPATMTTHWPPEAERARELKKKTEATRNAAVEAYRLANRGKDPTDDKKLLPFFATPQEGADYLEFVEARDAANGIDGVPEIP